MPDEHSGDVPKLSWDDFQKVFDWRQGEHLTLVGPTGVGKTELLISIIERREYVLFIGTKPSGSDETLMQLLKRGRKPKWILAKTWREIPGYIGSGKPLRVVLWPHYKRPEDEYGQAVEVDRALREAFTEGGWTIVTDELYWCVRKLGLGPLLESVWTQGRALRVTQVGGTQRPRWVPLFAMSQATHLFLWGTNDNEDLKRLGGLGGLNSKLIRDTVARLPMHDVLYLNTRSGQMLVTNTRA